MQHISVGRSRQTYFKPGRIRKKPKADVQRNYAMSEMNSDDMDDLFKKAGEQYPLRTNNAGWDAVSGKLDESNPSIFAVPTDSNKRAGKRKYLMLVALFTLGLAGYYGIYKSGHGSNSGSQKQISAQKQIKENNPDPSGFSNAEPKKSSAAAEQKKSSSSNGLRDLTESNNPGNGSNKMSRPGSAKNNTGVLNGSTAFATDPNNLLSSNTEVNNQETYTVESRMKELHSQLELDKPELNNTGEIALSPLSNISKNKHTDQQTATAAQSKTPISISKNRNSKFYVGIMIAPDISMVKFQSVKGVGFSAGLLAGYKISKKFSIETGAQLDIKNYYSDGEYFNKQNIPNLDYSDLINIKGNCKMIEVPLNLRYNFNQSRKNDWFITTGFSTYFMFRESYDYNYMHYGMQKAGYYATTKPSQYWFSVFNISIGYEHQIGKIGSLRVEPYLKTPLTGMGTGSLPIMSTGINLGIIHRF